MKDTKRKYTKHAISISGIKREVKRRIDYYELILKGINLTERPDDSALQQYASGASQALKRLLTDLDHYDKKFFTT